MALAINKLKTELQQCTVCCNISDSPVCAICSAHNRNQQLICVVEDMQDVMAIESTAQFNGLYHVLGGLISPVDGIGPDTLNIEQLLKRLEQQEAAEIIIALNANIEGDTTSFYLGRKLQPFNVKVTTISKGIAVGGELEYADEITLGRSIVNRIPYEV